MKNKRKEKKFNREERGNMRRWMKVKMIIVPIVAILIVSGTVLAVTSITTPTSLDYNVSTMPTTMQDFKESHCATMSIYTTVVLTDSRDSTQYQVRKMPDSKCWMIDNLKLAGGTILDSGNTNLDGTQGADFVSKWGLLSAPVQARVTHNNGECTADSTVAKANGSGNLTCDGLAYADTNDGFVAYSDPSTGGNGYENCVAGTYNGTSESSLTGCGYLYNWYTATAGSGNYQKGINANATASICPAGWHLPYNTSVNDFEILNNAMATGATTSSTNSATYASWYYNGPFQGSLSGRNGGSPDNQGYAGYYWGARVSDDTNAYALTFTNASSKPGGTNYKHYGSAIRCIL